MSSVEVLKTLLFRVAQSEPRPHWMFRVTVLQSATELAHTVETLHKTGSLSFGECTSLIQTDLFDVNFVQTIKVNPCYCVDPLTF